MNDERVFWGTNVAEPKRHPLRWPTRFWTSGEAVIDQARFESDVLFSGQWAVRSCYFEGVVNYDSERTRFDSCYFQNGYPEGPGEPGKTLQKMAPAQQGTRITAHDMGGA